MIELKAKGNITTSTIYGTADEILNEFSHVVSAITTSIFKPFNTEQEYDSVRSVLLEACAIGVAQGEKRHKDELKNSLRGIYHNEDEGCDEL